VRGVARVRAWAAAAADPSRLLQRQVRRMGDQHPSPPPGSFARHGAGSWVVPPAVVEGADRIEVGDGVVVMEHATLLAGPSGRIVLGDGVRLAPFASLHSTVRIELGAGVSTSDHVAILDSWGPVAGGALPSPFAAPVRIGAGAYLGAGSVVGPGVTIGDGAFVGEGSVVVDDVPAHAVVYGNPAVVVRAWDPAAARWDRPAPVGR
jgi:acetyltransferase-like isoleucine patch superfamily enzyme